MSSLLSIIILCYYVHKYVLDGLNSALKQDYTNKEIILVDDESNLKTKNLLVTIIF